MKMFEAVLKTPMEWWKPIKEAPKDGSILVFINEFSYDMDIARWENDDWTSQFGNFPMTHFMEMF